jgi:phospholipid transport system transporter-binding protein
MPTFKLSRQNDENYFIEGELTLASLTKKTMPSFDFLKKSSKICMDLDKVTAADSAGLALLLEWIKHSKKCSTELVFKNIPYQLLTLATLSDLDLNEYLTEVSNETLSELSHTTKG